MKCMYRVANPLLFRPQRNTKSQVHGVGLSSCGCWRYSQHPPSTATQRTSNAQRIQDCLQREQQMEAGAGERGEEDNAPEQPLEGLPPALQGWLKEYADKLQQWDARLRAEMDSLNHRISFLERDRDLMYTAIGHRAAAKVSKWATKRHHVTGGTAELGKKLSELVNSRNLVAHPINRPALVAAVKAFLNSGLMSKTLEQRHPVAYYLLKDVDVLIPL